MDLLLDTHAFLWWVVGNESLFRPARRAIENQANVIFVSAVSAWEVATTYRIGKLPDAVAITTDLAAVIQNQGFSRLPISFAHGDAAGALPGPHKDPFDRMLIAQAMLDGMTLISNEQAFDAYRDYQLW